MARRRQAAGGLHADALLLPLLLATIAQAAAAPLPLARVGLNSGWRLENKNGTLSYADVLLPNYPLNTLQAANVIGDPLYRFNETAVRWVTEETWAYEREFETPADVAGHAAVELVFTGLDTYAFVSLNGEQILYADNFHREWRVPVAQLLRKEPGAKNTLRVVLPPATATALELKKGLPYLVNTLSAPGAIDVFNFVRKPAYSFGWDWGTAIPATGIHGEIELVAYDRASVLNAHVVSQKRVAAPAPSSSASSSASSPEQNNTNDKQSGEGDVFSLDVEVLLSSPPGGDAGTVYADVALPDGRHVTAQGDASLPSETDLVARPGGGREFAARLRLDVPADAVALWWPAGYGAQPLYNLTVGFKPKGDDCGGDEAFFQRARPVAPAGAGDSSSTDPAIRAAALSKLPYPSGGGACTAARRRVGFRTIELVEAPAKEAASGDLRASWTSPLDPGKWPGHYRADENWATIDGQWQFLGQAPMFWGPSYPSFGGYNFTYPPPGLTTPPTVSDPSAPGGRRPAKASDGDSEAFYFRVNGVPVYSKGSNIIPFSILPTNVTAALITRTLGMAAATHQNTMRVWGGGYFMPDYFHDELDARGMLGWLETPFACNSYPSSMPGFLENVKQEVRQNVRRLGSHASTALWGGNNEVEASLSWYTNVRANAPLYVSEYNELFVRTIGGAMRELAPSTPYLDSSPSSGHAQRPSPGAVVGDDGTLAVKRWAQPQDPRFGDIHFYNYDMNCEDWRSFPNTKFVSEFGWQSPPTLDTFAEATDRSLGDWAFGDFSKTNDTMLEFRQRHQNGLNEILAQVRRHYRVPDKWAVEGDEAASLRLLQSYFWLSSAQQAACYSTGIGAWRRMRSEPSALTMGVLYWQLNDIWAGYSWSGYDWGGRWKPLNYAIKRQFAPLVAQVVSDAQTGQLEVFYVSDEVADAPEARLVVTVRRVLGPAAGAEAVAGAGGKGDKSSSSNTDPLALSAAYPLGTLIGGGAKNPEAPEAPAAVCAAESDAVAAQWNLTVALNGSSAGRVFSKPLSDVLASAPGCDRGSCYVTAELAAAYPPVGAALPDGTVPEGVPRDRELSSEGEAWLTYWKDREPVPAAGLRASKFTQESPRSVSFVVRAEGGATAPLVTLESPVPGHFSDSGFTLHAGARGCDGRKIVFTADGDVSARALRDGLRLSSLAHHQSWGSVLGGTKAPAS